MLATTLGVAFDTYLFRRPRSAAVRRGEHAVPPRSPLGRRQHRRLLLHLPGRSAAPLPDQRQQGRQRVLLGDRLQRTLPRRMVGPRRGDSPRHRSRRRRRRQLLLRIPRDARCGRADDPRLPSRPADRPPDRLEHRGARRAGPDPARRRRDRGQPAGHRRLDADDVCHRAAARRKHVSTTSTDWGTKPPTPQINSPIPTRCPTPTSAGRPATPATAYGSFVLDDDEALVITHRPPSCRFWNLVVWNQFMATYGDGGGPLLPQQPQRGAQQRRLRHDRVVPRDNGPPEFADDTGLSAWQPGVPLVPHRRGARAARGANCVESIAKCRACSEGGKIAKNPPSVTFGDGR